MLPVAKLSPFIFTPPELIFPQFVAAGTADSDGASNSFNLTPTFPGNLREGDLFICVVGAFNRLAQLDPPAFLGGPSVIATPTGWTSFSPHGTPTFNNRTAHCFYRFHKGVTDPLSVSIPVHAPGSSTEISGLANVYVYRGVRPANPTGPINASYYGGEPTSTFHEINTDEPYCLAIRFSINGSQASLSFSSGSGGAWVSNSTSTAGAFTSTSGSAYHGLNAQSLIVPEASTVTGGTAVWSAGQACSTFGYLRPVFGGGQAGQRKREEEG